MDFEADIKKRIEQIKESNLLPKVITNLNNRFISFPEINFQGRVKDAASAAKKCISKGYDSADQLTDLAGVMGVTKTVDDIYKIASYIKSNYEVQGDPDDYIKNPKLGYQSYHINVMVDGLPIEIQLKTQDMKRAQDFIHDRVYKNADIPAELKPGIMKSVFPIIAAAPADVIERNTKSLESVISRFEDVGYVNTGNMYDFIESNVADFKSIVMKSLYDKQKELSGRGQFLKGSIDRIDNEAKRLVSADFWLKDLEKNTERLDTLNKPLSKLKRAFSKAAREEYKKTMDDITLDKKFLKDLNIVDRSDFNQQYSKIDIAAKDGLCNEFTSITSGIENIMKAISDISKVNEPARDVIKHNDYER